MAYATTGVQMADLLVSVKTVGRSNLALREAVAKYLTQEVPGCKKVDFSGSQIVAGLEADGRTEEEVHELVSSLLWREYSQIMMPPQDYTEDADCWYWR